MDFNSLRYNLQLPYQQKNWKEWLLQLFGQQISIETQAEKIVVQNLQREKSIWGITSAEHLK